MNTLPGLAVVALPLLAVGAPSATDVTADVTRLDADIARDILAAHAGHTEDAIYLHAACLEAELDQRMEDALRLCRLASESDPSDDVIAFDLARLAFENNSATLAQDATAFLLLPPASPDAHLLRAYILAGRGERTQAAEHVAEVLDLRPGDGEALKLQALVGIAPRRPKKQDGPSALSLRLRTGIQYDTNVTVLPEDKPAQRKGTRSMTDGGIMLAGSPGGKPLVGGVFFSLGAHLTARDVLATFDSASAMAFGQVGGKLLFFDYSFQLNGLMVLIDAIDNQSVFMRGAGLQAGLDLRLGKAFKAGAYASAGLRDFDFQNADDTGNDRDGQQVQLGAKGLCRMPASLRLGWKVNAGIENAQGALQKVRTGRAELSVAYPLDPIEVEAALSYNYRNYFENPNGRRDNRLTPSIKATVLITPALGAQISYSYVRNKSIDQFQYQRQLAQLGVEAKW
jgi:hypothetical protein